MKRFPKTMYHWKVSTPGGDVELTIAATQWDQAGAVTLRYAGGYELLRMYFLKYGHGMYGHAVDLDDKRMIPEDIHHILLMNETRHHRADLIKKVRLITGFVPDINWLEDNDAKAGLMDDD